MKSAADVETIAGAQRRLAERRRAQGIPTTQTVIEPALDAIADQMIETASSDIEIVAEPETEGNDAPIRQSQMAAARRSGVDPVLPAQEEIESDPVEADDFDGLEVILGASDDTGFGPAIPAGIYNVSYTRHDLVFMKMFRRSVYVVHFKITTPGDYLARRILRFVNEPKAGRRLARSSTIARDWMAILQLRAPARPFRFSPRALYGGGTELIAHVVIARKMLGPGGKPVPAPPAARYSVINGFAGVASGTPLLLQRRRSS